MTRKDFDIIAHTIYCLPLDWTDEDHGDKQDIAVAFADALEAECPGFMRSEFLAACHREQPP